MRLFIAGLMAGGIVGVIVMCLMNAAGMADQSLGECEYEIIEKDERPPEKSAAEQGEDQR